MEKNPVKSGEDMSKRIYLTVDTECHNIERMNQYIQGETRKGPYGIEKILQLGQELNVPINVFLDIPECHVYGDDYTQSLVNLIRKYDQPVFLHVHPDYIGDPKRKHLWEYTKDEQREILRKSIRDYKRFCGQQDRLFFRAGAWGVNNETYEVLSELLPESGASEIIDLSYVYHSRWRCHLSYEDYGAVNACKNYKGITVFPNTTYIGFDYFGKQYAFGFCVPYPSFDEFKRFIDNNMLSNIIYAMHSWDFIKRWFFLPDITGGNRRQIRVFKKCIAYAKKKGYVFSNLTDFKLQEEPDQCVNLCKGFTGKIRCLWYNYLRFADNGRSYKKYALLYFLPVFFALIIFALICLFAFG